MARDDVFDLGRYWNIAPPLVECVRLYLGIKPAEEPIDLAPKVVADEEEWNRIVQAEKGFAEKHGRANPLA